MNFSCFYKLSTIEMVKEREKFKSWREEKRMGDPQTWVGEGVMARPSCGKYQGILERLTQLSLLLLYQQPVVGLSAISVQVKVRVCPVSFLVPYNSYCW